jgi:hypothetical protein
MKISSNIEQAENNYPSMYHVVNSNEVHSFETLKEAATDLIEALNQEEKLKTKFKCELIAPKLAVIYCGDNNIFDPIKKVFVHYRGNVDESSYCMLYNDAVMHLEKQDILGKLTATISEIPNDLTFDIVFDDDNSSNHKGFYNDFNYCFDYINKYVLTNHSYFADYKKGSVSIYCNETAEIVYTTEIF